MRLLLVSVVAFAVAQSAQAQSVPTSSLIVQKLPPQYFASHGTSNYGNATIGHCDYGFGPNSTMAGTYSTGFRCGGKWTPLEDFLATSFATVGAALDRQAVATDKDLQILSKTIDQLRDELARLQARIVELESRPR